MDRRFWVVEGRELDFEIAFAGTWKDFLRQASGYLGTEVECESQTERRYRVRDFWLGHRDFEMFRERFAPEYERFESLIRSNGLVEREHFVGAYYEKGPGEEDELVPG
ncbi:MAG: hypothetical protein ACRD2U_09750 [Terriglobales bacterium]